MKTNYFVIVKDPSGKVEGWTSSTKLCKAKKWPLNGFYKFIANQLIRAEPNTFGEYMNHQVTKVIQNKEAHEQESDNKTNYPSRKFKDYKRNVHQMEAR